MSWLHEQALKVSVLLDYLDGQDVELGHDFGWSQAGPGPAGYEPCVACAENAKLGHRVCPSCNGTRLSKSGSQTHGLHDPYLGLQAGPVAAEEDAYVGPQPITIIESPPPMETKEDVERFERQARIEPPPAQEYVQLTRVERAADRLVAKQRLLGRLVWLIHRAPRWVRREMRADAQGTRGAAALEWLGRRMPSLPDSLLH